MSTLKPLEYYTISSDITSPKKADYTKVYYYLQGKLVGSRVCVDGKYQYCTDTGVVVNSETDLNYAVREIVVDEDEYNAQIKHYSKQKSELVSLFINDAAQEYNMSVGAVRYFYNRFNHGSSLNDVIDELDYFTESSEE